MMPALITAARMAARSARGMTSILSHDTQRGFIKYHTSRGSRLHDILKVFLNLDPLNSTDYLSFPTINPWTLIAITARKSAKCLCQIKKKNTHTRKDSGKYNEKGLRFSIWDFFFFLKIEEESF